MCNICKPKTLWEENTKDIEQYVCATPLLLSALFSCTTNSDVRTVKQDLHSLTLGTLRSYCSLFLIFHSEKTWETSHCWSSLTDSRSSAIGKPGDSFQRKNLGCCKSCFLLCNYNCVSCIKNPLFFFFFSKYKIIRCSQLCGLNSVSAYVGISFYAS